MRIKYHNSISEFYNKYTLKGHNFNLWEHINKFKGTKT